MVVGGTHQHDDWDQVGRSCRECNDHRATRHHHQYQSGTIRIFINIIVISSSTVMTINTITILMITQTPRAEDTSFILAGGRAMEPSLTGAKHLKDWVRGEPKLHS